MADEKSSLRDVLSGAYDSMQSGEAPAAPAAPSPSVAPSAPENGATKSAASGRPRDDEGRFLKGPKAEEKPKDVPAPSDAGKPEAQGKGEGADTKPASGPGAAIPPAAPTPEPATEPKEPAIKAPQGWKPAAREKWASVPPEVQAEVARREREIDLKLKEVASSTREHAEFKQAAGPWEGMYRSMGMSASQAFDVMSRTYYTIQYGPPQQKAEALAAVIKQSGVPIEALATALDGQAPAAQGVDPSTIAQQVEQRIRSQLQQQAQQYQAQRVQTQLEAFAQKHEFFEDVRIPMADILTARGIKNPTDSQLEEVYNLACSVTPDISGVLKQREAAKSAETAKAATQRAAAAASSVKSNPAGAAPTAHPKGLREILESKYDEISRGG